jgi:hypothetical protein
MKFVEDMASTFIMRSNDLNSRTRALPTYRTIEQRTELLQEYGALAGYRTAILELLFWLAEQSGCTEEQLAEIKEKWNVPTNNL